MTARRKVTPERTRYRGYVIELRRNVTGEWLSRLEHEPEWRGPYDTRGEAESDGAERIDLALG